VVGSAARVVPLEEVLAVLEITIAAARAMKSKESRLKATEHFTSHTSRPCSRGASETAPVKMQTKDFRVRAGDPVDLR
jgi:hypothetical protein